jgi:hypothetical protein
MVRYRSIFLHEISYGNIIGFGATSLHETCCNEDDLYDLRE